ncbi:MAG: DUF167 domain-containing protein [Chloroflexi bacterium]|nr:DUF167 domain-containing protein [Chloroflexota bacterium]
MSVKFSVRGDYVLFAVKVVPRSPVNELAGEYGEALRVRVTAPPVGGAANEAVIALLADALGVPRRDVSILAGPSSRQKTIAVRGLSLEEVRTRLTSK